MKSSSSGQLKPTSHQQDSHITDLKFKRSEEKSNGKSRKAVKSHTKNTEKTNKTCKNIKKLVELKSVSSTIPNSIKRSPIQTSNITANLSPSASLKSIKKEKNQLSVYLNSPANSKKNQGLHKRMRTSDDQSINKDKLSDLSNSELLKSESFLSPNSKPCSDNKTLINQSDEQIKNHLSNALKTPKLNSLKSKIRLKYSLEIPVPGLEGLSKSPDSSLKISKQVDSICKSSKPKLKKPTTAKKLKTCSKEKPAKSKMKPPKLPKKFCVTDRNLSVVKETSRASTIKTENDEWINIADLNIQSANSNFVEEFKSKVSREFSQLVKKSLNEGQILELGQEEQSVEDSSVISSESLSIECPLEFVYKVQKPSKKHQNVPKLSLEIISDEISSFSQNSIKGLQNSSEILNSCKAYDREFGKSSENLVESTKDPSLDSVTVKCLAFDPQGSERNQKPLIKK